MIATEANTTQKAIDILYDIDEQLRRATGALITIPKMKDSSESLHRLMLDNLGACLTLSWLLREELRKAST